MLFTVLFVGMFLFLTSCKKEPRKALETTAITFTNEGKLSVFKKDRDSLITMMDIEIAESDYETATGLMYRKSMEEKQGMLFIFQDVAKHSFYMKNTEIPLDLIFIDENLTIVSFQKEAKPFDETSLSSEVSIKYVLEINAGLADKWILEVGDQITFERQ
ncbi:MAG: uncharacterized membrane protein (UPF0127 family) [Sediminicola sp.]|jgi:uncharacterized membrane protein (UPF0127 family)|tara:strand:+ start:851 stop:1330 length:480 start_codon:yes stop_codon:yes gene_type:complete